MEQPKAAMAAIDPLETLSNAIDGIESRYAVHGSFAMMFGGGGGGGMSDY